ncbi:flagellar biosynthesis protein FlhF [Inhella crocodyli]|uniref:Flagellar biosynthesis protein FlhF n=1 Tax=Inhella crocodyli TaxID=2499851 RepID=A0A437LAR7_9BURK|nr:flagellar biosynthesis protein FlhF [Inhella crocodyli]RVT82507.1 flagellar biosynthesis protein FlhF [Inhella crocodyli]
MNPGQMKRFAAPTTREAMQRVRAAFGDDAVVLSTKPCPEGIEVLAMPPDAVPREGGGRGKAPSVAQDVNTLAMSTLSFQDYVRERMLRRRAAEQQGQPDPVASEAPAVRLNEDTQARARRAVAQMQALRAQRVEPTLEAAPAPRQPVSASTLPERPVLREPSNAAARWAAAGLGERPAAREPVQHDPLLTESRAAAKAPPANARDAARERVRPAPELHRAPPVLRDEVALPTAPVPDYGVQAARQVRESADIAQELRAMKGLIEARFGALAFMEKMQRQPQQAQLAQRLIGAGFSPAMVRKLVDACPSSFVQGADEQQWAQAVLARNLQVADTALEDRQGVFALIGSTGVGKTTTTAKIAANFAAKHGASQLGLITLDAYRIGAHEQLRGYGRILGVPVHTAHDRASLDDLLDLLANKKLVLIDTAGMAQRDARTHELLDMLAHPAIRKLLVVNASAQGETNDEVVSAWRAADCEGVILSKLDEAVRLGPALDSLIRHRLRVQGLANGQRVPEDWLRLPADELMKLAFKPQAAGSPWRMDEQDLTLLFAGAPGDAQPVAH